MIPLPSCPPLPLPPPSPPLSPPVITPRLEGVHLTNRQSECLLLSFSFYLSFRSVAHAYTNKHTQELHCAFFGILHAELHMIESGYYTALQQTKPRPFALTSGLAHMACMCESVLLIKHGTATHINTHTQTHTHTHTHTIKGRQASGIGVNPMFHL